MVESVALQSLCPRFICSLLSLICGCYVCCLMWIWSICCCFSLFRLQQKELPLSCMLPCHQPWRGSVGEATGPVDAGRWQHHPPMTLSCYTAFGKPASLCLVRSSMRPNDGGRELEGSLGQSASFSFFLPILPTTHTSHRGDFSKLS